MQRKERSSPSAGAPPAIWSRRIKREPSDAPSFASVAHKIKSSKALTAFLTDPHPKMPDMNLTRSEIADIVAYIGTLGR
jgi:hypothetical protein